VKRTWAILAAGLLAAAVGYCVVYFHGGSHKESSDSPHPELAWLKQEFHLSDPQFQQVLQLHDAYRPKCAAMCRRIDEINTRVKDLLAATNNVTPDIQQALQQAAQLRAECEGAMLQHFYEVSRVMPPEQSRRYLEWVQGETLMPSQMIPVNPSDSLTHH